MKKILLLLIIFFGATFCTPTHKGEPQPGQKTAILVEGLISYEAGYVRDHWKPWIESKGFFVYSEPWTTDRAIKADLCVCHSFGGKTCIEKFIDCKVLITCDARSPKGKSVSENYKSPGGTHINFYQKSGLRGWPISGAVNIEVSGDHTSVPKKALEYLKEKGL